MAIKSRLVFLVACALLLISLAQWVVGEDGHPAKKGNPETGETVLPSPALEDAQVILAVEDVSGEPNTPRHLEELHQLLERMDCGHGTWSTSHPRHRLLDALHGFSKYEERQKAEIKRLRALFDNVSKSQKKLLNRVVGYGHKLSKAESLVHDNNMFCQLVVENALEFYRVAPSELDDHIRQVEASGKVAEKVSVSQALKHVVRDWTASGVVEREEAYACIAQTMSQLFPNRDISVGINVLLPGAGLGRLGHEIAKLGGFEVTNNEWSMYMNVIYRFIEGHRARLSKSFYPFVDGWSHHATTSNMFRRLDFPDAAVNATAVVLVEGDFTTAFHGTGKVFHAVITHFFIDTARNLMSYFETINKLLTPGGYWINFGPLLYGSAPFVQLSLEEIIQIVEEMGLEFLDTEEKCGELTLPGKKVRSLEVVYGFDDLALFKNAYKSQFWVTRKKQ